jgi:DNA-binding transcriptional LysR family regulator
LARVFTISGGTALSAFKSSQHALADAAGMGHAVLDQFLRTYRLRRDIALRIPGLHVLPMIIADSDLVTIVPRRLAEVFAPHIPIRLLPMPIPIPAIDIRVFWHERYHQDPAIRWVRNVFMSLFKNA